LLLGVVGNLMNFESYQSRELMIWRKVRRIRINLMQTVEGMFRFTRVVSSYVLGILIHEGLKSGSMHFKMLLQHLIISILTHCFMDSESHSTSEFFIYNRVKVEPCVQTFFYRNVDV
jgi:hypothetical protein